MNCTSLESWLPQLREAWRVAFRTMPPARLGRSLLQLALAYRLQEAVKETIRQNLRDFIDKGFTAHHDVVEYLDSPLLKIFHGTVRMTFDDPAIASVRPTMTHFFYMDERDPTKVSRWVGSVGPTGF